MKKERDAERILPSSFHSFIHIYHIYIWKEEPMSCHVVAGVFEWMDGA